MTESNTDVAITDEFILQKIDEIELGKCPVADFVALLKSRPECNTPVFHENLVGLLWIKGSQSLSNDAPRSKAFASLLKELIGQSILDLNTIKLSLEISTLVDTGVIRESEENHQKRLVKINTNIVYRQQKYNILREETEGYAKLVTILSQLPKQVKYAQGVVSNIQALIGQFDLDPNRVLDLTMDAFEQQLDNLVFIEIFKIFRVPNIVHILGFKLLQSHPTPDSARVTENTAAASKTADGEKNRVSTPQNVGSVDSELSGAPKTPSSLYQVAAALIMFDLVALTELLPYLHPTVDNTITFLKSEQEKFKSLIAANSVAKDYDGPWFMEKDLKMRGGSSFASAPSSSEVPNPDTFGNSINPSTKDINLGKSTSLLITTNTKSQPPSSTATTSSSTSSSKPPPPSYPPPKALVSSSSASTSSTNLAGKDKVVTSELLHTTTSASVILELFSSDLLSCEGLKTDSQRFCASNQYIGLIVALLHYRGWTEARTLLERLWIAGIGKDFLLIYCPPLRRALSKLISYSLQPLLRSTDKISSLVGKLCASENRNRESHLTLEIETKRQQYERIPCIEDFPLYSSEVITLLGYHLSEDNQTYVEVCRVLRIFLTSVHVESPSHAKSLSIALILLHGLSVSGADATYLSHQLWSALKLYSFSTRFSLYDSWRQSSSLSAEINSTTQEVLYGLALAERNAFQSCRRELKRLAKDNTKVVGRNIAKYLHANPMSAIRHILNQIAAFDNLIPHVIEAFKYSLDLSRDVVASQILLQLKKFDNDNKLKSAGGGQSTHYAQWFSALSRFIGTFYCRYPLTCLTGLLHYLLDSLGRLGQSADLLVIKDLLGIMGGCDTLTNVSTAQLEGLAGGKTLRGEVMGNTTTIKSGLSSASSKKSAGILREELIKSNSALPLLLFIAQLRNQLLFDSEMRFLKVISHLYDVGQDLLIQFTDFLVAEAKSLESIATMMPSIEELTQEIGLSIPIVFQLVRPLIRAALQSSDNPSVTAGCPSYLVSWHPFGAEIQGLLPSLLEKLYPAKEEEAGKNISKELFILFWSLTLYDIYVPAERYQSENKRIKDRFTDLDNKKESQASLKMTSSEYAKYCKNRDADMKNMMVTMMSLQEELNLQKRHVDLTKETLLEKKQHLFVCDDFSDSDKGLVDSLLQSLVYNRVLMSPIDSIYCTKFARLLHDLAVPGFSLVAFYHRFFEYFLPLVFSVTECEAAFIGYAIDDVLTVIQRWQQSLSLFQLEALRGGAARGSDEGSMVVYNGFIEALADKLNIVPSTSSSSNQHFLLFKDIAKKWHTMLFSSIVAAINGREYMYIRSAFVLLAKISNRFPYYRKEGNSLLKRVETFIKEENREDLQIMARSLLIPLKKRQNDWMNDLPLTASSPNSSTTNPKATTSTNNITAPTKKTQSFSTLTETYSRISREKDKVTSAPASSSVSSSNINNNNNNANAPSSQLNAKLDTDQPKREPIPQTVADSATDPSNKRKTPASENSAPPPKYPRRESESNLSHDKAKDREVKENKESDKDRERDREKERERERDVLRDRERERDRERYERDQREKERERYATSSSSANMIKPISDNKYDYPSRSSNTSNNTSNPAGSKRPRDDERERDLTFNKSSSSLAPPDRDGRSRSRDRERDTYRNEVGSMRSNSSVPPSIASTTGGDRLKRSETDSALHRVNNQGNGRGGSSNTPRSSAPHDDSKEKNRPPPPPQQPPQSGRSGTSGGYYHHSTSYDDRSGRGGPSGSGRQDFRPPPPPSLPPSASSHRDQRDQRDQDSQYYHKKPRR